MSRPKPVRTLGELVDSAAAALGPREAVRFNGWSSSFGELSRDVADAAKGFMAQGIQSGEHVMLFVPNCLEWIHAFFGLAKIGAVIVPINTRFRATDLDYVLRQSDASTLVISAAFGDVDYCSILRELLPTIDGANGVAGGKSYPQLRRVVVIGEKVPAGTCSWQELIASGSSVEDEQLRLRTSSVNPSAPALMLYTSGTTGFPKGALHNHAMVRTVADAANRIGITSRDSILGLLPLFHSFGLFADCLMFVTTGARLVLTDRFDAGEALALIEREKITFLPAVDTHYYDILAHETFAARGKSSLRVCIMPAGTAGAAPLARRVNKLLCKNLSCYGSSEGGSLISLSFLDASEDERCTKTGFPLPGYEYRTLTPETGEPVPPNEFGELWVRGYGVMLGYYGKPAETSAVLDAERWFRTGDRAVIDRDGFLHYAGRYKDMLRIGGENVDPTEVEAFLEAHPDIADIKVVGAPDERQGEVLVACVIPKAGRQVTLESIQGFCLGKIASFKVPRRISIMASFPMTTTGKVQRNELKNAALAMGQ